MNELIADGIKSGIDRFVVTGIIFKGDTCLLLQRKDNDFWGGFYEAPGGKVEDNESIKEALIREIKEETNLMLEEIEAFVGYFDYLSSSGKKTRNFAFNITVQNLNNIKVSEHQSYKWVDVSCLNEVKISKEMLDTILQAVSKRK